jgi:HMG (high mobility group) box
MSAFLKYSQKRRQEVKEANPEMNNTDISRLLGELWRAADAAEKEPFVESEKIERSVYNEAIATWREEQAHLDAASRTSHHTVQHPLDKSIIDAPPIKKKRREHIQQSMSDSSQATAPSYTSSDGKIVDRRIFRSYSGSSHPHENRSYAYDPRNYHSTYYPSDSTRSYNNNNNKEEQSSYYHRKPTDAASYKPEPISTSVSGTSTVQPVEYPTRYHPHQYRPQYPTPNGENRHTMPLPNNGSDLFDNGFHDPEPPFNPRQTRPSSHYNGYFFP